MANFSGRKNEVSKEEIIDLTLSSLPNNFIHSLGSLSGNAAKVVSSALQKRSEFKSLKKDLEFILDTACSRKFKGSYSEVLLLLQEKDLTLDSQKLFSILIKKRLRDEDIANREVLIQLAYDTCTDFIRNDFFEALTGKYRNTLLLSSYEAISVFKKFSQDSFFRFIHDLSQFHFRLFDSEKIVDNIRDYLKEKNISIEAFISSASNSLNGCTNLDSFSSLIFDTVILNRETSFNELVKFLESDFSECVKNDVLNILQGIRYREDAINYYWDKVNGLNSTDREKGQAVKGLYFSFKGRDKERELKKLENHNLAIVRDKYRSLVEKKGEEKVKPFISSVSYGNPNKDSKLNIKESIESFRKIFSSLTIGDYSDAIKWFKDKGEEFGVCWKSFASQVLFEMFSPTASLPNLNEQDYIYGLLLLIDPDVTLIRTLRAYKAEDSFTIKAEILRTDILGILPDECFRNFINAFTKCITADFSENALESIGILLAEVFEDRASRSGTNIIRDEKDNFYQLLLNSETNVAKQKLILYFNSRDTKQFDYIPLCVLYKKAKTFEVRRDTLKLILQNSDLDETIITLKRLIEDNRNDSITRRHAMTDLIWIDGFESSDYLASLAFNNDFLHLQSDILEIAIRNSGLKAKQEIYEKIKISFINGNLKPFLSLCVASTRDEKSLEAFEFFLSNNWLYDSYSDRIALQLRDRLYESKDFSSLSVFFTQSLFIFLEKGIKSQKIDSCLIENTTSLLLSLYNLDLKETLNIHLTELMLSVSESSESLSSDNAKVAGKTALSIATTVK